MKTLAAAAFLALPVLLCGSASSQAPVALETRLAPAIAAARDTRDRLDAVAASPNPAALRDHLLQFRTKLTVIRSLTPDAPPAHAQAQRLLEQAVDGAVREDASPARIADISARFEELFPAPGGADSHDSGGRMSAVVPPPAPDAARARSAASTAEAQGHEASSQPDLFYDGQGGRGRAPAASQKTASASRPASIRASAPGRGGGALPPLAAKAVPAPPSAPGPVQNCEKALDGALLSVGGLCQYSPAGAAVLGGLLDAVKEQFMTVEGVALNVVFMLMGVVFAALTGGIGLILKILVALGMTAYAAYSLLPRLASAVKALWNSKEGSAERYAATRTLSGLVGGLMIMALMGAVGVKLGASLPASWGAKIASMNAATSARFLPAGVSAMLAKFAKKPAAEAPPEPVRRSVKSQALYSEDAVLRNAELPSRPARVEAAMEQLGVDRPFAEKVAAAHERVPCAVGECTPAQLRAKLDIMGPGPKSDAAIRSGLAGSAPRLSMRSPAIKDYLERYAPDRWKRTVAEGAASGSNHIDKHHSPSLPDWARDGPGSLQSRIKPNGIQFASKFDSESALKASVAELRRLIKSNVEYGRSRTPVENFTWSRPYRPASYYDLLQMLTSGRISECTLQFKMPVPVGRGMGFNAEGQPALIYGLRWVRATLVRTKEGIVIKTIYPAEAAP